MAAALLSPSRTLDWCRYFGPRLFHAVMHDVRQRYAGSVLGSAWAVLYPMALLSFYATIYIMIFKVRAPGLESGGYTVMIMSGLVPIIMFTEAINTGVASIHGQKTLLLNTVFPAELLPLRSVLAAQVPSLSALAITTVAAFWTGQASLPVALVVVPVAWLLLIMFVTGLVWILSLLSLVARDIQQALGIVTMAVMMLSPMAYTPEMVPEAIKFILWFNPMSYFILCFQSALAFGRWPDPVIAASAAALGIGFFAVGLAFFRRTKFIFMDHA